MGKIVETRKLYEETINDVTQSVEKWQSFLDSSSWNFKYDFDDQILIYAQRPNARACASIEEWNKKLRRWIKKGSNGIFVQSKDENSKYPFRIVFDISDTYNARRTDYKLWEIKPEYEKEIIDTLESNFGEIYNEDTENKSLAQAIYLTAFNMVEDNIQDYMEMIKDNVKGTKLDGLDESSIENITKVSAIASVSYMIMIRCGINPKEHIDLQDISYIEFFNGYQTLTTIGNAISDIAEQGLREIAKTVFELQKNENIKNRTFEKNKNELYAKDENKEEGGIANGRDNLHEGGRLQYTQYDNGNGEITNREIRKNEIKVSEGTQQATIHDIENGKEISRTFDGDTGNSISTSITDSGRNGETGESERRIESPRPDEMGAVDEQLEDDSRGDSGEGNNLRLTEYKKENDIGYVVVDEKINQILATTTYLSKHNSEIIQYFDQEKDISKRAEYLKNIVNNEYTEILIDNERFGYKKFENGILFWKDGFLNRTAEILVSWNDLTYHYEAMILLHQLQDRFEKPKSEIEQQSLINEFDNKTEDFEFTQEFIDRYLQERRQDLKFSVYTHFRESLSSKENIDFLKRVYGIGGSSSVIRSSGIGVWHDAKGMKFNRGYFGESAREQLFNWNYIEKRISELIKADRYLNPKELEEYPKWLEEQENTKRLREAEKRLEEQEKNQENELAKRVYEYHLGDTVYLGADTFEIVSIDNDIVTLSDSKYPLFTQQLQFEEFEKRVKENPSNNHLIVEVRSEIAEHQIENQEIYRIDDKIEELKQQIGNEELSNLFDTIISHQNIDTNFLADNTKTLDEKEQVLRDKCEYYENDFGGLNPTDGYFNITEDSIEIELYSDESRYSLDWKEFTRLFIDYANLKEKEKEEQQELKDIQDTNIAEVPKIKPNIVRAKHKIQDFVLHPEIPESNRNNFKITDDNLGVGGQKEKYARNIDAIKVLKKCEEENRYATVEEQKVLSQYVGWGGLADAFNKDKPEWSKEYNELKELLNDEEYAEARESTLTAFYTPPIVIKAIYKALQNMGLKNANILEPSCGIGNFIGVLPQELENCKIYGIEKDNISGIIAQQLYQKSTIAVQGYEKVDLPDSFFDVALGNVPFGEFKVMDKRYDKYNFLIHDYFFR